MHQAVIEPAVVGVTEVDLEHETCCEFVRRPTYEPICDRPAEWVLRTRCCGLCALGCDPHVIKYMALDRLFVCKHCGTNRPSPQEAYTCTRL